MKEDMTNLTSEYNDGCAQENNGQAHLIIRDNSFVTFKWFISSPVPGSTCFFEISNSSNTSFRAIAPYDVEMGTTAPDAKFPCGMNSNSVEEKSFLVKGFSCDSCAIRWNMNTTYGIFRQCADAIIYTDKVKSCFGLCEHHGVCVNGKCECTKDYDGDFCEFEKPDANEVVENKRVDIYLVIIALLMLLIVIVVLVGGFIIMKKKAPKRPR
eukprot:TRINITY_DN4042_c0_g1_i7.p1 TRINITY_DN4042_c0_g1~~TRINITY_DN4042_c0_g1_i7.p1  ORF type:complete len:211 (+),score=13.09 TRINITY_DN4042_c0_g1_i7:239-871(+)